MTVVVVAISGNGCGCTGGGAVNVGKRSTASLTAGDSSTIGRGSEDSKMVVCGAAG